MGMVGRCGRIALLLKGTMYTAENKVKAPLSGQMAVPTQVILPRTTSTVKVSTNGVTVESTLVPGLTIKCMGGASSPGPMAASTKSEYFEDKKHG